MSNHTKEPWRQGRLLLTRSTKNMPEDLWDIADKEERKMVFSNFTSLDEGKGREFVCGTDNEANASRICSCVNACADMEDPVTEIAKLRADNKEMLEALKATREQLKKLQPITLPNQEIKYHISDGLFLIIKRMEAGE